MRNIFDSNFGSLNENESIRSTPIPARRAIEPESFFSSSDGSRSARNADIPVIRDLNYGDVANKSQTLDLLIPRKSDYDAPRPVIVSIHGGAFARGDKSDQIDLLCPFVSTGQFVGVSINYRLSGEALWPAQIYDCKAVIRWIRANARAYGFAPERIGVIGQGAGGNLAAMLGVTNHIRALDGDIGRDPGVSCAVQCVVCQFGPTDLLTMPSDAPALDHSSESSPAGRLLGGALQSQIDRAILASPITYVSKNSPPFLLVHDTQDPVIPYIQSERMYNALKDAGGEAYFLTGDGIRHGQYVPREIADRIRLFFERHLLPAEMSDELPLMECDYRWNRPPN